MNKTEALQALEEGKAIRHKSFLDYEFIRKVNGKIIDEAGIVLNQELFLASRNAGFFNEGWTSHEISEVIKP